MQDTNKNSPKTIDNLTNDAVKGNDIKGGNAPVPPIMVPPFDDGSITIPGEVLPPVVPGFDDAGNEIPVTVVNTDF